MGDFNLDLLKIEDNQHIKDFTDNYNVFFSILSTYFKANKNVSNTSETLTDNIFVNKIEESYKYGILFTDLSDHFPVFLTTSNSHRLKRCNAVTIKQRLINEKNN